MILEEPRRPAKFARQDCPRRAHIVRTRRDAWPKLAEAQSWSLISADFAEQARRHLCRPLGLTFVEQAPAQGRWPSSDRPIRTVKTYCKTETITHATLNCWRTFSAEADHKSKSLSAPTISTQQRLLITTEAAE
jgi:hypothetical protein